MRTIKNYGWFTFVVSALVCGDYKKVNKSVRDGYLTDLNAEGILGVLEKMSDAGFAPRSRKGWHIATHPQLGEVAWKSGYDFRTGGRYFFLRVNGQQVLSCWPNADGRRSPAIWLRDDVPEQGKKAVEEFLGCLKR